ncbi:amino acid ABC transporter substrate-binding protein [Aliikangiella marina]|uniref:Amino acid ABC transporter substrate-binding protein n=1 Tax=Aliikangiella marina TaxID=1712262 RepID=A0A545T146_9GAMM|nr:transporter substrate-binding domain-containing protein [Aliikangiella marina]TQV70932.1 amino acid ABC transporter substrate-binding protein [Aliikangiella marina]
MKRFYSVGLISCLVFVLASCSDSSDPKQPEPQQVAEKATPKQQETKPTCQLNMGWDPWAPYQYLTPENEVKGLEIELVSAMAKEAGCELKFVQKSWMNLLNGIRNGSIDLLGGASKTSARERFARFSDEYRNESFILYVRRGEADKFKGESLKDLLASGFKLGVTEDYIYGDEVSMLQDDPATAEKFVSVPTTEVNYYNLIQNRIDGFLEDPFVAAYTIRRKGLGDEIEAHPIRVHSGNVALMFSKKSVNEDTVIAFNEALTRLMENGEYKRILDKYSF